MKLEQYKQQLRHPLRSRTVTFLLKDNQVLLGHKKRGFGKGYYIGIGGKVEDVETIQEGATRELKEEINIGVTDLHSAGTVHFYFPHIGDESWNQIVHIFTATSWKGDPVETDEILPEWFDKQKVPYEKMWDDAKFWIPHILDNQSIHAEFLIDGQLQVVEHTIKKE